MSLQWRAPPDHSAPPAPAAPADRDPAAHPAAHPAPVDPPAPADPAAPPHPPAAASNDELVLADPTVITEMLQVAAVACPHCGRPDLRIEPGRILGYALELTMRCAGCEVDLVRRFLSRRHR